MKIQWVLETDGQGSHPVYIITYVVIGKFYNLCSLFGLFYKTETMIFTMCGCCEGWKDYTQNA